MNQRKMISGVQIIVLLLLIQAAYSWNEIKSMRDLQGIVQAHFSSGCTGFLLNQYYKEDVQYIASLPQSGFWDLSKDPIENNEYHIQKMNFTTVQVQQTFEFPNSAMNGRRKVSGLLAYPIMPGPLKGIVIYFHGTFFSKDETPSNQTYPVYKGIASIFGAKKYAVLFPDYLGYGADEANVHPYVLYPQHNILTANYLLNHVAAQLNQKFGNVNAANPLPVMSNGYSQGGAYGVYFGACNTPQFSNKLTYCNKVPLSNAYILVAVTGSEGAYDTAGVLKDFLLQQVSVNDGNPFRVVTAQIVNLGKPGLSVLAIYSFGTYNPKPFALDKALVKDYYDMKCHWTIDCNYKINDKKLNIQEALSLTYSGKPGSAGIFAAIFLSALGKKNNDQSYLPNLQLLGKQNSILALIDQDVVLNEEFFKALNESTIIDYGNHSPFPVFLFSLDYDSIVSPINTRNFLQNNDSRNVHKYILDNSKFTTCTFKIPVRVDHIGGYFVSHVFVLKFFEDVLKSLKPKASDEF